MSPILGLSEVEALLKAFCRAANCVAAGSDDGFDYRDVPLGPRLCVLRTKVRESRENKAGLLYEEPQILRIGFDNQYIVGIEGLVPRRRAVSYTSAN